MPQKSDEVAGATSRGEFRRLFAQLAPHKGLVITSLLLLLLSMPCELFPPLIWLFVADALIVQSANSITESMMPFISLGGLLEGWPALLVSSLVWLSVVYVVGEFFQTLANNIMARVAQRMILRLRNQVYHKLQTQSLSYLQRQRTGDLMSRAMGDVDELQGFIVNGIDQIIGEGVLWVVTVVTVLLIDWRVASASLAPLVIVYFMLRFFNARIRPIYKTARDRAGDVSSRLQENLSGVVVIKIFGREREEADRFHRATRDYYDAQVRAINARSLFFPFSRAVGFLSNVFMIGIGAWLILTDRGFTLGKLLAFRAYWWRLFGPISTLARVNDMVQRASAAARRVFEVLDAPDELPDLPNAVSLSRVEGRLELRNVSFRYDNPQHPQAEGPLVLSDVNLMIEPGQTVALCGPSGSGKTTVLSLLLRFYDPTSGAVLLDGHDLRQVRKDSLRSRCALVQQESFLFNESIVENIRYGRRDATLEEVIRAAKAANAHGFISQLPRGYDTVVGERGVRLSGGQKQRISIARAFLADPTILLLDEPTSSVEPDSEQAIIAALDRLMVGRTTVITSHRPSLIGQADVVYVIRHGRIVDSGTVEQVRARDEWFARFMASGDEPQADSELASSVPSDDRVSRLEDEAR
jgi:ABC-type multidrug transport system fused ATPase/permease subunit